MIEQKKTDDFNNGMKFSAFTAWQNGAGHKLSFDKYLRKLNLVKIKKMPEEERKQKAKEAYAIGEEIKNADKLRFKK